MKSGMWIGLGALVLSGAVQAGPYFGGAGLMSEREGYEDLDRAEGAKAFLGYRFDDVPLMLELSYLDAGDAEIADTGEATLGYSGLQFSAGWFGKLSPTGSGVWVKGGYYSGDSEVTDTSGFLGGVPGETYEQSTNGLAVGLGGDWKVTRWVGLRFELEGLLGVKDFANDENLTSYSLGLVFEFPNGSRSAPVPYYSAPAPAPAATPERVAELAPVEAQPPQPVYTAEPAAPVPVEPAPVSQVSATASYNAPAATSTPVPAAASAGWMPGASAHAAKAFVLRKTPVTSGLAETAVPAGGTLQLLGRQTNAEGTWWLATYEGSRGWVPQTVLTQ